MKKSNLILLLSLFAALITLTSCQQPSSSSKEDPPLPPSAQELISDSIYQTDYEDDNPKTATQLRFNEDGTIAKVWGVLKYDNISPESFQQNLAMLRKQNPKKIIENDDTNHIIYINTNYKYKTSELLFYGYFLDNYEKYIMLDYKGVPDEVYTHQI